MNRKGKIIIAEDEALCALALKKAIIDLGYEVCAVVSSGEEVIKKTESEKPDAVLSDVNLKGKINGITAAKEIWSDYGIPAILLTGYSLEDIIEETKSFKPAAILSKPASIHDIETAISSILTKDIN